MIVNYNWLSRGRDAALNNNVGEINGPPSVSHGVTRILWPLFLLLLFLGFGHAALGQVSVTASAGTAGPTGYTTLNAAFAAINAGTHQGAINVAITGNTTEPAVAVPLLGSGGTSNYSSISIMPSGGNWTVASAAAPTASRGVIEFNGADNVTINGDDPSTPGVRNLTISVAQVSTAGVAAIRFASASTTDGAINNTVKHCTIQGSRNSETSVVVNYGIYSGTPGTASTSITGLSDNNDNLTIENNAITRCSYAIYVGGTTANFSDNLIIRNNVIGSASATADRVAVRGIVIVNTQNLSTATATVALIEGNDIQTGTTSGGASYSAIEVGAGNAGAVIRGNNIHDCLNPTTNVWGMYGLGITSGTNNSGIQVYNNFFRDINGYASTSSGSSYAGCGIFVSGAATGLQFMHNTFLQTANTSAQGILFTSSTATVAKMLNNIFVVRSTSANAHCVYTAATANISGGVVNNNSYFVNAGNVGYYSSANRTTLSAWQAATGQDANSLTVNPTFTSATDLHIPAGTNTLLESGGAVVATTSVNIDFDGQNRPGPIGSVNGGGTKPDIGADEFDGIAVTCFPTGSVTLTTFTNTSASFSWIAASPSPSNGYFYEIRTAGAPGSGGAVATGNTAAGVTTVSITGLQANTAYSFYVRSFCGGTDYSPWSAATAVFTGYCVPVGMTSSTSYYLTNVSISNATVNLSNTTTGAPGGYADYSATLGASHYPGGTLNVSLTPSSGTNYFYIWIDWNKDLDFADAGETILATTSYTSNYSGTFTIPVSTPLGAYRMRVAQSEAGAITSCGPAAYGEYEDYTFNVVAVPTCFAPSALNVSSLGDTSVSVTFTPPTSAPANGYEYYVSSSSVTPGASVTVTGTAATGATAVSATGLTANTTYYLWIRSVCSGSDSSSWSSAVSFTTLCAPVATFNQNFDAVTTPALPACWDSVLRGSGIAGNFATVGTSTTNYSTPNSAALYNSGTGSTDELILISPNLSNLGSGTHQLRFYGRNSTATQDVIVGTVSGYGNNVVFTPLQTIDLTTSWTEFTVPFTSYAGTDNRIGFKRFNTSTYTYVYLDNIVWEQIPTCFKPSGVTVSAVTTTTATLTWAAGSPAPSNGYQFEVRSSGAAGSGSAGLAASGNTAAGVLTANVSGLSANMTYSVYVRSYCGGTDYSAWQDAAVSFTTLCNPTGIPLAEGFNAATMPSCWTTQIAALQTTSGISFLTSASNPTAVPQEGSHLARYNSFNIANNSEERLILPPLNTTGIGSVDVNFYFNNSNNASYNSGQYLLEGVQLQYSVDNGTTWTDFGPFIARHDAAVAVGTGEWKLKKVTSSAIGNRPNVMVALKFHSGYGNNMYVDNLAVSASPPVVSSFAPSSVCNGGTVAERTVVITGAAFTGANSVTVNGVAVQSYTIDNSSQITAVVGAAATSGNIVVTGPTGVGTSATALTVNVSPTVSPITAPGGATNICLPASLTLSDATPTGVWSSSNTDVATVNASGVVTSVALGNVVIKYTVTDGLSGCSTAQTYALTISEPVSIVSSTPSQSVVTNGSTTFNVEAVGSGNPALTYQWYEDPTGTADPGSFVAITDGGIYSGATTATLQLTNIPAEYLGYFYYATVTGICNSIDSSPAILLVGDTGIESNPEDVTVCNTPGTASFTIVASDDVNAYEWQEDQGGDNWTTLSNSGMYSGVDTPTLSLSGIGLANNGWRYKCVVYGIGAAESTPATLTVIENINITASPSTQVVCYTGGVTSYTVNATGGIGGYDWQYSANNGASWSSVANGTPVGVSYSGAGTTTLTVTTTAATPAAGTYSYRAFVNGASSCPGTPSAGAQLVINNPTITAQPTAATASAVTGVPAAFTVSATSYLAATYQWQYATTLGGTYTNVVDNTPAGLTYTGANSATLNVTAASNALASTARYYRVIVSSGAGCSVTSNGAQLTVTNYCTPAMATVSASGDYLNNFSFANITNNGSGDAANDYTYYSALTANVYAGQTYNVSLQAGGTTSTYAQQFRIWIDYNRDGVFSAAESVYVSTASTFSPSVTTGTITIPQLSATVLQGVTRMRVASKFSSAPTATESCTGSGAYGEFEDYNINIQPLPGCSGTPVAGSISASSTSVCVSGSVVLTASGYDTLATGLTYQWYNSAGPIAAATGFTYTTPVLTASETYYFRVTCSNGGAFSNTTPLVINVNNPAVVNTTPATRCGAGTVTLSGVGSSGTFLSWYGTATGGAVLASGNSFVTPVINATTTYYVEADTYGTGSAQVGAGNLTGTVAPYSFGNGGYGGMKGQYLVTAAELTAAGIKAGNLNSVAFDVSATGSALQGFTVQIGSTALTEFVTPVSIVGGLTTVVNSATFTPVVGINTLNFTTPFVWDGTSNIVVSTSWSNNNSLNTSVTVRYNATTNYSSQSYRKDNETPANMLAFSGATGAGTFAFDRSQNRPKLIFGGSNVLNCQSARTAVVATVNTAPALTLSSTAATLCAGSTSPVVNVTSNQANFDTYVWSPATNVSGSLAGGFTFNPAATTVYTLTASQSGGSQCTASVVYTVTVNPLPPVITAAPATSTICVGNTVALSVSGASNGSVTVGTGTASNPATGTTATAYPAPYGAYYENAKQQYLIRASELTALGLSAGSAISSLAFNVTTVGTSGIHTAYTVSIGNTAQNAIATFESGLTQVFGPVNYQPVNGLNTHVFTTPFVWNGTSNIVVQVCHSNDTTGAGTFFTSNAQSTYSVTTFNSSLTYRVDNIDACGASTITYTEAERPNMTFTYSSGDVTWAPVGGLYTDAAATIAYTGTPATTVYAKPTSSAAYVATITTAASCTRVSNTVTVNVNQNYPFYADADGDGYGTGAPVSVCAVNATTPPAGYALNNTDCNDNNSAVYQSATLYVDADGDGYSSGVSQVVCYGATIPAGYVANATAIDCNDTVAAINPGHAEVLYNGVDDNCDGQLDEGFRITTSLLPASCGTTLASIGSLIGITTIAPGSAYTGWRIRLTNGAQVQIIEKNVPHFTLPEFPSYAYATTYTVEIELQRNGVWLGYYGPACLVSTPAILEEGGASAVSPSQCGITLPKINTLIATTSLQGVTGYRFKVTNLTDPLGPNAVQTIDRTQNWFSLPMLTRYNYGTTYRIEIAVKTTGAYGGFGAPCEVSSPPAPSLINCGGIAASGTSTVAATSVQGATQYRFQITRQSDLASATIDRSTNYFIFNSVPASAFTPGALYGIRVAVMTSGFWSPFGDACEYTAPGGTSKGAGSDAAAVVSEFRATAYPNPFTSDFGIDVISSSQDNVQVRVYDMLGKLIEDRSVRLQELSLEKVGAQYPSGVYNVIVTQGEIVKTLRVIKR